MGYFDFSDIIGRVSTSMRYLLFVLFVFMGPNQNINAKTMEENVFTLIRNNHVNPLIRVHIATFDSANGPDFNA